MTFVILGPPGSGKGTQGKKLATYFHLAYVATGDLVRAAMARAETEPTDPFARLVRERYLLGRPQPDEVIVKILRSHLQNLDLSKGIVFDTFPLSFGQAQELGRLVRDFHLADPWILYLSIDDDESIRRISNRKFCLRCGSAYSPQHVEHKSGVCSIDGEQLITRADDRFYVVVRRLDEYKARMLMLRRYYSRKGRLIELNGQQTVDDIFTDILEQLERKNVISSQKNA